MLEPANARLFLAEARGAVDHGLEFARRTGARLFEAELHRLLGEVLWLQGKPGAADACEAAFEQAIRAAVEQGAWMMELRGLMGLVRLRMALAHPDDLQLEAARSRLELVFDHFTEGLARPDLREAARLLGRAAEGREGERAGVEEALPRLTGDSAPEPAFLSASTPASPSAPPSAGGTNSARRPPTRPGR